MLELLAQGRDDDEQWRRPLRDREVIRLGREPLCGLAVPWDPHVSREQADLIVEGERVRVRCLDSARNPAHFRDEVCREFVLEPGDAFRIGGTTFRLEQSPSEDSHRLSSDFRKFLSESPSEIIRQLSPAEPSSRIFERRTFESTILRKFAMVNGVVDEPSAPFAAASGPSEFELLKAEIARLQVELGKLELSHESVDCSPPWSVGESDSPRKIAVTPAASGDPTARPDRLQNEVDGLRKVVTSLEHQLATERLAQLSVITELKAKHADAMAERAAQIKSQARQNASQAEQLRQARDEAAQHRLAAEALRAELARVKALSSEPATAESKRPRAVLQARQRIEELATRLEEEAALRQAEEASRERAEGQAAQYKAAAESLKGQVQKLRTQNGS